MASAKLYYTPTTCGAASFIAARLANCAFRLCRARPLTASQRGFQRARRRLSSPVSIETTAWMRGAPRAAGARSPPRSPRPRLLGPLAPSSHASRAHERPPPSLDAPAVKLETEEVNLGTKKTASGAVSGRAVVHWRASHKRVVRATPRSTPSRRGARLGLRLPLASRASDWLSSAPGLGVAPVWSRRWAFAVDLRRSEAGLPAGTTWPHLRTLSTPVALSARPRPPSPPPAHPRLSAPSLIASRPHLWPPSSSLALLPPVSAAELL